MFCQSRRVFMTAMLLPLCHSRIMMTPYRNSLMNDLANSSYVIEPINSNDTKEDRYEMAEHVIPKLAKPALILTSRTKSQHTALNSSHKGNKRTLYRKDNIDNNEVEEELEEQYGATKTHFGKSKNVDVDNRYGDDVLEFEEKYNTNSNDDNDDLDDDNNYYKESIDSVDYQINNNDNNNDDIDDDDRERDEQNISESRNISLHGRTKTGGSSSGNNNSNNRSSKNSKNNNKYNSDSDKEEEEEEEEKEEESLFGYQINNTNRLVVPPRAPRNEILQHKSAPSSSSSSSSSSLLTTAPYLKESNSTTADHTNLLESKPQNKSINSRDAKKKVKMNVESTVTEETEATIKSVSSSSPLTNLASNSVGVTVLPASTLTNPFRGLHERISRSYRLDPMITGSTSNDILLARQEKKSTAFSFLKFQASQAFFEGHWNSIKDLQQQQRQLWEAYTTSLTGVKSTRQQSLATPPHHPSMETNGLPNSSFTLFNNNIGLNSWWIHSNYALIIAQRLLLFPDHMRHFHTICGRDGVPCDFFADVDLPDETQANGEQILLEILNYLEVRLPGVGFTDPFFLVLTNEEPSKDKVSYHIHARSMTYAQDYYTVMSTIREMNESNDNNEQSSESKTNINDEQKTEAKNNKITKKNASKEIKRQTKQKTQETKARIIAFQDYKTVKLIVEEVNQTLGRTVIDESCYRPNGMLRCAFSAKLHSNQEANYRNVVNNPKRRLVPMLKANDPVLQSKLSAMETVLRTMTDAEILELTFCTRFINEPSTARFVQDYLKKILPEVNLRDESKMSSSPSSSSISTSTLETSSSFEYKECENAAIMHAAKKHTFKLIKPRHILGPQASQVQEYDNYGNAVSPYLCEAAKWRRYRMVVEKLHTLPPRVAEQYDTWVRIGLALHNFSNEDHVFEEWVRFSLKCPIKYSREVCKRKWIQFERNPDALNWRRGFNYLNACIWREV